MGKKTVLAAILPLSFAVQAATLSASRSTSLVENPRVLKPLCSIIEGTKMDMTGSVEDKMWLKVTVPTGDCKGKTGFISAENVKVDNEAGLRLSRSAPLVLSNKTMEFGCFVLENTPVEKIGEEKGAITPIKVRVKDGHCKGKEGWVSEESLRV